MSGKNWREWFLGAVTVGGVASTFWFSPLPQDPTYHEFADRRTFFGTPNFWNVFSNLPFVLVGAFGLRTLSRLPPSSPRSAYVVFCIGVVLVGFGSAYYHYSPSTPALVWDRVPMTIAFMALFSMVVRDRISEQGGRVMLWPLVLAGVASVGYWYWSEIQGQGDLRAYGVIQFLPMLLIALMLIICSGKGLSAPWLWGALGTYALAKVAEYFDQAIYNATGIVSGHSIKHGLGALAVLWAVFAVLGFSRRQSRTRRQTVSKPTSEGLALLQSTVCLHWNHVSLRKTPSSATAQTPHPADRHASAEGSHQPRHRSEVQHPPEIVR